MKYMQTPEGRIFTTEFPEYSKDCKALTVKVGKPALREQCKADLLEFIKPGQTVYCTLRSVSKSGMKRVISLHVIDKGEMRCIDYWAVVVNDDKLANNGIVADGCGMDMGFSLVYNLGANLWPNGTPEPHGSRNGAPDSAGGYALKHQWL